MQSSLPKSSLVIRDFKLWRDGMPNKTDDPRVMLALIQFPHSYRSDLKTRLPVSVKNKTECGHVVQSAEWMPDGYDYLQSVHGHAFTLQLEAFQGLQDLRWHLRIRFR